MSQMRIATQPIAPLDVPRDSVWHVDVVSDVQQLLALEPAWVRLAERATTRHPFCTFDWVRTWWEAFGAGRELHVLVARRRGDSEIDAIAPLMLVRGRLFGLPIRRLQSISNEQTPRFDFLVADGAAGAFAALWDAIRRDGAWDVLQLTQVTEHGPTLAEVERMAIDAELPIGRWLSDDSPYLVFDGGEGDVYERTVGRKHRKNVERLLRRLSEVGPVELEIFTDPGDVERTLPDAFRLEASGWKDCVGTSILTQPAVEAFYRTLARRHSASRQLRLIFLKSNGVRVAFMYGVRQGNALFLVKCGYDPDFSRYAPVHLLCHLLFSEARARALGTVEFLGTNDAWKQRWTRRSTQHVWLFVFRNVWWTRWLCRTKFELVPRLKQKPLYRALLAKIRGRALSPSQPFQPSGNLT